MLQSYILLLRNICSSSLNMMFVLENPATKAPTPQLRSSPLRGRILQILRRITSKLCGKV